MPFVPKHAEVLKLQHTHVLDMPQGVSKSEVGLHGVFYNALAVADSPVEGFALPSNAIGTVCGETTVDCQ